MFVFFSLLDPLQISHPFCESWYFSEFRVSSTALSQDRELQQHTQQIFAARQMMAITAEATLHHVVRFPIAYLLSVFTSFKIKVVRGEIFRFHPRLHIESPIVEPADPKNEIAAMGPIFRIP